MDSLSVTEKEIIRQSPVYSFMYVLKSSEARRQYPKRLKMLFDFLNLSGSLEEQANEFLLQTFHKLKWKHHFRTLLEQKVRK